ncbi:CrcB family protein [Halosegnis longus]|uniref:Fluoride-specific ion channel FluC n=1 Tax=Halosegnis longus TaxID=2216012 RepID=A0AAJ4R637_9EURY|nr:MULTISPECIES: CrcB family protein [Halobacteriales]RNJ25291.1 chromosome condensation protein CrcB [Salella cibi]
MERNPTLALVAVGGALGAVCRWGVGVALAGPAFPVGTLAVNVLGAFLLGVLLYDRRFRNAVAARTRLVAGTGFLSSFTTYSTFAAETVALAPALAGLNLAANYALGFLAVLAGRRVAGWSA